MFVEQLQALNQTVLVEILEKREKKLASGIILAGDAVDGAMKNLRRGKILSIGDKVESSLKVGDVVVFSRFVGSEIGDNHLIIQEKDLLAVEKE